MEDLNTEKWFAWSLHLLSVGSGLVGAGGLVFNTIVMWLTVTTDSLRVVPACRFIFGLAACDFILSLTYLLQSAALHFPDSLGCAAAGYMTIVGFFVSVHFPPLIAYSRYVRLCVVNTTTFTISRFNNRFSVRNVALISALLWGYSISLYAPFAVTKRLGPDQSGLCLLVYSDSWSATAYFNFVSYTGIIFTYSAVIRFYRKITNWIKEKQSLLTRPHDSHTEGIIRETESFLKLIRWLCIMPLVVQFPVYTTYMLLNFYELPHWLGRCGNFLWSTIFVLDPCVTLLFNEQYKQAFVASKIFKVFQFKLCVLSDNTVQPCSSVQKIGFIAKEQAVVIPAQRPISPSIEAN